MLMNQTSPDNKPAEFSVKFVSYNKTTGKGGRMIELQRATLSRVRASGTTKTKTTGTGKQAAQLKAPNHEANGTVNFLNLSNNNIVKAHWKLIVRFNGERVI
jgi:hypothetical protein